jgi:hypothetical protein
MNKQEVFETAIKTAKGMGLTRVHIHKDQTSVQLETIGKPRFVRITETKKGFEIAAWNSDDAAYLDTWTLADLRDVEDATEHLISGEDIDEKMEG